MSLPITPITAVSALLAEKTFAASSPPQAVKAVPPPPPPPPPPQDIVSLSGTIKVLQSEGKSPAQIALTLGVPQQTIAIDLGTSFIETRLAAAPTIPVTPTIA